MKLRTQSREKLANPGPSLGLRIRTFRHLQIVAAAVRQGHVRGVHGQVVGLVVDSVESGVENVEWKMLSGKC